MDFKQQHWEEILMGRTNDGEFTTISLDLHLDLSLEKQVELSFWIKDISEENHPEDSIWFSNDGGETFVKVYQFDHEMRMDNTWEKKFNKCYRISRRKILRICR